VLGRSEMSAKQLAALSRNSKEVEIAKRMWTQLSQSQIEQLEVLLYRYKLSVSAGDLLLLNGKWYVTHSGLLRISHLRRCAGMQIHLEQAASSPSRSRWVFRATVHKSASETFVAYGDADPSNVSPLVHGAEMRVAETRAVNRALRKAYGIGICSVEELGSTSESHFSSQGSKKPSQPANGNCGSPKTRDRLCQLIRQHELDPTLVKAYAVDFCGTNTLREANREQVGNFVAHLAEWAEKDRSALVCHLKTYAATKEGAA